MHYEHKRTEGLTCELLRIEKKGKQEVCVASIGDMVFRANKEIFHNDWQIKTK